MKKCPQCDRRNGLMMLEHRSVQTHHHGAERGE